MKNLIFVLTSVLIFSCKSENSNQWNLVEYYKIQESVVKKYWATNDPVSESELGQLLHDDLVTTNDSIEQQVKNYYQKISVDDNSLSKINQLFDQQNSNLNLASIGFSMVVCEPVYRDILIFKKDNQIVGIAKICFECGQNSMVFENKIYDDEKLDYEQLARVLSRLASR